MWFFLAASGCKPPDYGDGPCAQASDRVHKLVCVHDVVDLSTWETISVDGLVADQERSSRYMVPVSDASPLPTLFANANAYTLHYDMLVQAFPDLFAGLTWESYYDLVVEPAKDGFFSGDLSAYIQSGGTLKYGFTVWDDPSREETTITQDQVTHVYEELSAHFRVDALMFVPSSNNQRDATESWGATPFEIRGEDSLSYESYSQGTAYGTLRFYTLDELNIAEEEASFGYQDILVLDEAPLDVERVVAAFVTGTRQGSLSHLNVRSTARGTPNCYLKNPFVSLQDYEGQLVAFSCNADTYAVTPATLKDAQAWWDAIRPEPTQLPPPDLTTTALIGLLDLPTQTAAERAAGLAAYGAKGSNLATLYQRIPSEYQLSGFLIPFYYYDQFMHQTTWEWQGQTLSFADTLDLWLEDPLFTGDGAERRTRLTALQDAIEAAPIDPTLIELLATELAQVWPPNTTVRFRSSSNAEDILEFSGAGLYTSVSVCAEDSLDGDESGGSRCDAEEEDEETIERGLKKVWASLWGVAAYEERDWYGIDPHNVAMGVLVDTRVDDEQANIVAFTGNPTADDDRYLVEAQVGELAVVAAEPGVYPERTLLTLLDGDVTEILRVETSSEVSSEVLADAELTELGELLWQIQQDFPIDASAPPDSTILLDTEWKVLSSGQLIIKQVRTFLREDAP